MIADLLAALPATPRRVLAIAGESGAGKTTLAEAIQRAHPASHVLGQDAYFLRPPRANHAARRRDLGRVGPHEVDLARLQAHLDAWRAGAATIERPVVDRAADRIGTAPFAFGGADLLIVEGTYVLRLARVDQRVFVDGDWRTTAAGRRARARDLIDDLIPQVLAIEQRLIQADRPRADVCVSHAAVLALRP